jgi:SAM-dependent methyltransferase
MLVKQLLKRLLPAPIRAFLKTLLRARPVFTSQTYQRLYDTVARNFPNKETSVGDGNFDLIGKIELGLLKLEGLQPAHRVYDFGCGVGRLAVQLIPYLTDGGYFGSDISPTMLKNAREMVASITAASACRVVWIHQENYPFPVGIQVDYICAFSVFTHMEHEDAYRYLVEAKKIIKPDGKLVFSCLPLDLELSRTVFLQQAQLDFEVRWRAVRNIATTTAFMETIAALAGWKTTRWYPGNLPAVDLAGIGPVALGQSVCVLTPA